MARYHKTEGICLRRLDFSNTSQIACFLTPDAGRLSFMAKGVTRAPKRGIRTGFDLLGRYELIYTARAAGSLQNLTDRSLRASFPRMGAALQVMLCGYYAAELVLNFTIEGDPCPALYTLLAGALRRFDGGNALGLNVLKLEAGVLLAHGTCPTVDACVECGRGLPSRGRVAFRPAAGGALCRECAAELPPPARPQETIPVRADVLASLAKVIADPDADLPARPDRIVAMSAVLRCHMRELLGRELRMWKYLQKRHLSRSLRKARRAAGLA